MSENTNHEDTSSPHPTPLRAHPNLFQVAKDHLGVCYNPIRKTFGRVPVITMKDSHIEINHHASRQESKLLYSDIIEEVESATKTQLGLEFEITSVAGTQFGYSKTSAARSAQSSKQHMFKA